jgi:hypothetical protein
MKTSLKTHALVLPILLVTLMEQPSTAIAQGTAFTYQGTLNEGTNPANGIYDLRFTIYDSTNNPGVVIAGPITNSATAVSNGLITAPLDFGAGVFTGAARWLEIGVRTNGAGAFTPLTPRQPLTPAPYAIHAARATIITNGSIINATFIGTTTGAPLELSANNQKGLRLESPAGGVPNLIAGGTGNAVVLSAIGSTIAGGGVPGFANSISVSSSFIGAGNSNSITGPPGFQNAFIGAGYANSIAAAAAFIGSGNFNSILAGADFSLITGGRGNTIGTNAHDSTIGGGSGNSVAPGALYGSIGGGLLNTNAGYAGVIAGGERNANASATAVISGGRGHLIATNAPDSTISGGYYNTIQASAYDGVIGGGAWNAIRTDGPYATIAGGTLNTNAGYSATIGGGRGHLIDAGGQDSTIVGGYFNTVASGAQVASIGGGAQNRAAASLAVIGGGNQNTNAGFGAVIGGGRGHVIATNAPDSTIGGGYFNTVTSDSEAASIAGGARNLVGRTHAAVGGGNAHRVIGYGATISGGEYNTNLADWAFIGGGRRHVIEANAADSTIAGGYFNAIAGGSAASTIGGGGQNFLAATIGTISGGGLNTVTGFGGVIGGGESNTNNATSATIGGGQANRILPAAFAAAIPGGQSNVAGGQFSFAAGRRAIATNDGAFVWADSINATLSSTNTNSITIRASGGYRLFSNTNSTAGVFLAPGGTSWSSMSDRDAKKNFAPVDSEALLQKLATVPVQQWHYEWESDNAVPHIGPLAQDFKGAFFPGRDDKVITTQEVDGVVLAAIQGLNRKTQVRNQRAEDRIQKLETENAALMRRIEKLEGLIEKAGDGSTREICRNP